MSDAAQKKRLEDLWKLSQSSKDFRDALKTIYDTSTAQCTVSVPNIVKEFTEQWNKANPNTAKRPEKELFQAFAKEIKKEWLKKVQSGSFTSVKKMTSVVIKNTGTVLQFTLSGQSKTDTGEGGNRGLSNNFKVFFEENKKIFLKIANTRKFKPLFRKEGRDNRKRVKVQRNVDIGHVHALSSQGRASAAEAILGGLDMDTVKDSKEVKKLRNALLKLGLQTDKKVTYNTAGKLVYEDTIQYQIEASATNKNKEQEEKEIKKVGDLLREGLQKAIPTVEEYVKQGGSPSMIDTVGDMIVNTPIKKAAYKNKRAKNLTKYRKPLAVKTKRSSQAKEEKFQGVTGAASFGLTKSMAAGLPKSQRPGKRTEGGSGQTPEDFAQKIRGLLKVKRAINARLPAEVRRNMGRPALTNKSGRFSNSAQVTEILPAAQTLMVKYTYRLNPYETFENTGKKRWPTGYNPKPLIAKSIRGLALGLVDEKLTIRRA